MQVILCPLKKIVHELLVKPIQLQEGLIFKSSAFKFVICVKNCKFVICVWLSKCYQLWMLTQVWHWILYFYFRYCQLDLDVLIIEDLSFSTMNIFPYCFVHCCHRTFTNSYRRLRIMKGSEAIGLGMCYHNMFSVIICQLNIKCDWSWTSWTFCQLNRWFLSL